MRSVIFVGMMLLAAVVNGQQFPVKGEVIDLRSEERIKHATVQNVNRQQSVLTDHRGEFTLMVSVGDTITITATKKYLNTITITTEKM